MAQYRVLVKLLPGPGKLPKEVLSVLMLCAPVLTSAAILVSYENGGFLSISLFCPFSREKKWHKLRKVY